MNNDVNTETLVLLYLNKARLPRQHKQVKELGIRLTGISKFDINNQDHRNKVMKILGRQHRWLQSLRYDREGYDEWMENIIKQHGKTQGIIVPN